MHERKFKIGDRVRPTNNRFVPSTEVCTVKGYGNNKNPDPYNANTYHVEWDGNTPETEIFEEFIEPAPTETKTKAYVTGPKGSSSFVKKPEILQELVGLGILFHNQTNVHDNYVEYVYGHEKKGYCVQDNRSQTSLWEQYPQEV